MKKKISAIILTVAFGMLTISGYNVYSIGVRGLTSGSNIDTNGDGIESAEEAAVQDAIWKNAGLTTPEGQYDYDAIARYKDMYGSRIIPGVVAPTVEEYNAWKAGQTNTSKSASTETTKTTSKTTETKEEETPVKKISYTVAYKSSNESVGVVTNDSETLDEGLEFKGSTAIPNEKYELENWTDETGAVVSTDLAYIPQDVTADHTFTANFKAIEYTVTYVSSNEELGTVSNTSEVVSVESDAIGSEATLNSGLGDTYYFAGWRKDGGSIVSTETTIIPDDVDSDITYTAVFKPTEYTISYSVSDENGGVISTETAAYTVESTPEAVTFNVADGYEFTGWSEDGIIVSYDTTFIPNVESGNHSYVANVEKKQLPTLYIGIGVAVIVVIGVVIAIFARKKKKSE